jgi:hypothetical protein
MAQTYTRQSTLTDGDTITASLFNNEYNQIVNAFAYSSTDAATTGHRHDGSAAQGGNIPIIGDLNFFNKIVVDGTNNRWGIFVEVAGGPVEQVRIQDGAIVPVTTNDIDLGTGALQFKDIFIDGTANIDSLVLTSGSTVTAILDEDDLVSDSATALATQQSIKAYVDAQVTAQDLDIVGDTGTDAIDLDSETLTFTGGTGITSVVTAGTVTHNIDSTVATLTGTQTLTNKTITSPDINGGTIDGTTLGATTPASVAATTLSTTGGAIFNEGGVDADFRVASVGNANALFVDGGNNSVGLFAGIGDTVNANLAVGLTGVVVAGDTDGATIGKASTVKLVNGNNYSTTDAGVFLLGGGTGGAVGQISSGIGFFRESNLNWGTQLRFYVHETATSDIDMLQEVARFKTNEFVINETSHDYDFRVESVGNANMLFVDGGNNQVFIGASSASALNTFGDDLVVVNTAGGTGAGISIIANATDGYSNVYFGDTADGDIGRVQYNHGDNSMTFRTNAADALVIASTGAATFNAGITATTLSTTGAATIQGLTVGRGAGAVASNTAVGSNALAANTTGASNVASGYQALFSSTTGGQNVANGYQALRSNTTGSSNTANGYLALYSNTTAANNVANGREALYSNTTGGSNVLMVIEHFTQIRQAAITPLMAFKHFPQTPQPAIAAIALLLASSAVFKHHRW